MPPTLFEALKRQMQDRDSTPELRRLFKSSSLVPWLNTVELVSAEKTSRTTAKIVYRFPVLETYLNMDGGLQGGFQAALYDVATSGCLWAVARPGFWTTLGTTRSLSVTCMRPALEGETLLMECELVHAGKQMANLRAVLRNEKTGAIISTCEHDKFNTDPPPKAKI